VSPTVQADLELRHPGGSTLVFLGHQARERAAPWLGEWSAGRQLFLITTPTVENLLAGEFTPSLQGAAEVIVIRVPEGEAAKSLDSTRQVWEQMLAASGRRDSRVIGLGGGSVGDLAGFVAGTFLRGVDCALVPTTLLAQVDASIGGKTGIDLGGVKNSIGAFHHPAAVISDVAALRTLPAEELRSGLVEMLKIAAADDLALFERLEREIVDLLAARDPERLGSAVRDAVAAKIRVVEADPTEGDRRRVLNFGHTLGHAIESALDYESLRHGEAVAYGMLFATRLAAIRGADPDWLDRIRRMVGLLGLPPLPRLETDRLLAAMERDKKATRSGLLWVLPSRPGEVEITGEIDRDLLRAEIDGFLAGAGDRP
jgi:3-dehydroquinate synthase